MLNSRTAGSVGAPRRDALACNQRQNHVQQNQWDATLTDWRCIEERLFPMRPWRIASCPAPRGLRRHYELRLERVRSAVAAVGGKTVGLRKIADAPYRTRLTPADYGPGKAVRYSSAYSPIFSNGMG